MHAPSISSPVRRGSPAASGGGAIIGALGGLIGLGSADRLPLLHGFLFIVRELLHTTGVSMIEGPDNAGEVPQ
jgi:hypothetical protein